VLADLDGDKRRDIVFLTGLESWSLQAVLNAGKDAFEALPSVYATWETAGFCAGDLDGDDKDEVIVTGPDYMSLPRLRVFKLQSSGLPAQIAETNLLGGVRAFALTDLNGDRALDVVSLSSGRRDLGIEMLLGLDSHHGRGAHVARSSSRPDDGGSPADTSEMAFGVVAGRQVGSGIQVRLSLPSEAMATLDIHDVSGRRVASRDVGDLGPGVHDVLLANRVPTGVYWLRLRQAARTSVRRMVVIH
jgi:hypothetical protein